MSTVESQLMMGSGEAPRENGQTRADESPPRLSRIDGILTGALIGFKNEGQTPLVVYPGQPDCVALAAATVVDVYGSHIGRQVALMFENGDARRPIIMGLVRVPHAWPLPEQPGQVEVDADGERLVVTAKEQLVLRCGKASITLTQDGSVRIRGEYISTRATGTQRIRGGSVQIN